MRCGKSQFNFGRLLLLFIILGVVANSLSGVEWSTQKGARSAELQLGASSRVGFSSVARESSGIFFTNRIPPERHLTNQVLLNGSGVTAGDIDGDGWCDLFFAGMGGCSRLYRNLGGWKFEDITQTAGLLLTHLDATGAAFCDLDGDNHLDLVINSLGQGTAVFFNDGQGHFRLNPASPVLNPGGAGTSIAVADLDGDGWLDLYLANYRRDTLRDQPQPKFTVKTVEGEPQVSAINGRPVTDPAVAGRLVFRYVKTPRGGASIFFDEQGESDAIFRNLGKGRFVAVGFTNGMFLDEAGRVIQNAFADWGLSVILRDLNGDGSPDIYICNDFTSPDRIWINDGHGHFRAVPGQAFRHTSLSTMALDIADINRDGHDDIFTADMLSREHWRRLVQKNEPNAQMHLFVDIIQRPQYPHNCLQLARGDGTFAEIAELAGLESSEWTWTSMFLDVDLDGYEDLLAVNGYERDYMNMDANRTIHQSRMRAGQSLSSHDILGLNRLYPRLDTTNLAFRNLGNCKFAETASQWGFNLRAISQGMCAADLDNDGDLDLAINNCNGGALLLRNETAASRVTVRLKGKSPNTRGIGARITLLDGALPMQSQEMMCGGRYQSSDEPVRVFAAGSPTKPMTLQVAWRSGAQTVVTNVKPNRIYEVDESMAAFETIAASPVKPKAPAPWFRDVSLQLNHTHLQVPFNDFERQPLLPRKLSTAGPGLAWFDFDGDDLEDLAVAGGKGSQMALFRNTAQGNFTRISNSLVDVILPRSQTTLLGVRKHDGNSLLLAGSSNFEDETSKGSVAQAFVCRNGTISAEAGDYLLPDSTATTGPLAMADVDGDGTLELFVGGRCLPGRWPEPASSLLLRQTGGKWVVDEVGSKPFAAVGLVNGAVFTDLDGDGYPELILACEWGPIHVFRNEHGTFAPWTWRVAFSGPNRQGFSCGLDQLTGWWNGVAAGDFDGDGKMDLVAANWGQNTKYERYRTRPLRITYGDFNGDGSLCLIENCFDKELNKYVPILSVWTLSRSLPWLLTRYPSFESFSRVGVEEALGEYTAVAKSLQASWLESTLLLNRGDHFEARALPLEAQATPAFAICVADFDGNGSEDVFLSQNFFGVPADTGRYDAGRGLLLRGDGQGSMVSVPGQESGLLIYGEQRGAAVCDYDADGRVDLAVMQVGAETKLYHNETARPGLRVRLKGPPGNPDAIGALLRLKYQDRLGPAREIHAGSGYWSQDSAVQVMQGRGPATHLWVRWPGGSTTTAPLPQEAAEVLLDAQGHVQKRR